MKNHVWVIEICRDGKWRVLAISREPRHHTRLLRANVYQPHFPTHKLRVVKYVPEVK